jgi:hypothetical protein
MAIKDVLSNMKPPVPAKNDPEIFAVFPHSRASARLLLRV